MLYVGTSGWAYPRWKPEFYPADMPPRQFLSFYSSHLNSVEVNYTFCGRHVLRRTVAERWLEQTHKGFMFTFRGPKPITHFYRHRLRNAEAAVSKFETTLLPFREANRLGPVLFQLPTTFPIALEVLDDFLRGWPRELRVSFEFRDPSWLTDEVYTVLRRHGVALCLAERDESTTPDVLTADFAYLRLRKSSYSPASLQEVAKRIYQYSQYGHVFAFFRQSDDRGPSYAEGVLRRLRALS